MLNTINSWFKQNTIYLNIDICWIHWYFLQLYVFGSKPNFFYDLKSKKYLEVRNAGLTRSRNTSKTALPPLKIDTCLIIAGYWIILVCNISMIKKWSIQKIIEKDF